MLPFSTQGVLFGEQETNVLADVTPNLSLGNNTLGNWLQYPHQSKGKNGCRPQRGFLLRTSFFARPWIDGRFEGKGRVESVVAPPCIRNAFLSFGMPLLG